MELKCNKHYPGRTDLSSEWWAGDEVEGDSEAVGEGVSNVVL